MLESLVLNRHTHTHHNLARFNLNTSDINDITNYRTNKCSCPIHWAISNGIFQIPLLNDENFHYEKKKTRYIRGMRNAKENAQLLAFCVSGVSGAKAPDVFCYPQFCEANLFVHIRVLHNYCLFVTSKTPGGYNVKRDFAISYVNGYASFNYYWL